MNRAAGILVLALALATLRALLPVLLVALLLVLAYSLITQPRETLAFVALWVLGAKPRLFHQTLQTLPPRLMTWLQRSRPSAYRLVTFIWPAPMPRRCSPTPESTSLAEAPSCVSWTAIAVGFQSNASTSRP